MLFYMLYKYLKKVFFSSPEVFKLKYLGQGKKLNVQCGLIFNFETNSKLYLNTSIITGNDNGDSRLKTEFITTLKRSTSIVIFSSIAIL